MESGKLCSPITSSAMSATDASLLSRFMVASGDFDVLAPFELCLLSSRRPADKMGQSEINSPHPTVDSSIGSWTLGVDPPLLPLTVTDLDLDRPASRLTCSMNGDSAIPFNDLVLAIPSSPSDSNAASD